MTNNYQKTIQVSIIGERTFEQYVGEFKFRTILSYQEQLAEDRLRREYVEGPADTIPSPNAESIANLFAYVQVRTDSAPTWWTESRNGLGLYDNNVIMEVYQAYLKAVGEHLAELKSKSDKALEQLRAKPIVESDKVI